MAALDRFADFVWWIINKFLVNLVNLVKGELNRIL